MDNTQHDELRRRQRCEANFSDHLPDFAPLWRIGLAIAFDIKRLLWRSALERAIAQQIGEIRGQLTLYPHPQARLIGLERGPRHIQVQPAAQRQKEPPDVDISPVGIAAERTRTPDANAASPKRA